MGSDLVYLSLGSNIGDKSGAIDHAIDMIAKISGTSIVAKSSVYKTAPWGNIYQDEFLNLVIGINTQLEPKDLLEELLAIEHKMGRVRKGKNSPRIIDIDILFFGSLIINQPNLVIPHPRMHLRNFVLIPMNEIAPELVHPVLKKSIKELCTDSKDKSRVIKITPHEIKSE
jgi:dihydroneopterin aldolase/2-amino-4-hydroxy-6-hydroxymethyldihydropteridine diphosphokinase